MLLHLLTHSILSKLPLGQARTALRTPHPSLPPDRLRPLALSDPSLVLQPLAISPIPLEQRHFGRITRDKSRSTRLIFHHTSASGTPKKSTQGKFHSAFTPTTSASAGTGLTHLDSTTRRPSASSKKSLSSNKPLPSIPRVTPSHRRSRRWSSRDKSLKLAMMGAAR